MRSITLLFIFFHSICIGINAQISKGFQLKDGFKRVSIPIEFHNNLIVAPIVLNQTIPLRFVLDTGVPTTILTEKEYAYLLDLSFTRNITIYGAGGEKLLKAYIASDVSINMHGVEGNGHSILVLDQDYMELKNFLGTNVNGILGYEFFSKFIVKVDYVNKRITLYEPNSFKVPKRYTAIPISVEDTKPYFYTNVTLKNGQTIRAKLLIDSGASTSIMLDPESDEKITFPANFVETNIGRGLSGNIYGKIGRIDRLNIGDYQLDEVISSFPNPGSYVADSIKINEVFRNGSVGGEILKRFHIIYDYPNSKIYVKKNSYFKSGFDFNLSGIVIKASGPYFNTYQVAEVRKNSAAALAGVKVGDQLVAINNILCNDLKMNQIIGYFNSKPNKRITLEIKRGEEKLKIKFTLQRQI